MKKTINNNQNGITLIALVITIIVLLILAGVAISMLSGENGILRQAASARTETEEASELEKMQLAVLSALTAGNGKVDLTKNSEEANSIDKALKEEFGNKKPNYEEGLITLSNGDIYKVTTSGSIEKAITFRKTGNLVMGTEVTASNGEKFYVIGEGEVGTEVSEETQNDILLLAKYNLRRDGAEITLKQDTAVDVLDEANDIYSNACAFCSSTAWSGANVVADDNLNNKQTIKSESISAVGKAIAYGESLGVTGRLMTYEEAYNLENKSDNTKNILYGKYESGKFINYWLGSADNVSSVWFVNGNPSTIYYSHYEYSDYYGVRPVIEVSESLIK